MVTGSVHEYRLTAAAKRIDNRVFLSRIYLCWRLLQCFKTQNFVMDINPCVFKGNVTIIM